MGFEATVDAADYEWLMQWKWFVACAPERPYAARTIPAREGGKRQIRYMAREIMGNPEGCYVDHIDHDSLNNRRSNLRQASNSQNRSNCAARRDNTSGVKGVYWHKRDKRWIASLTNMGRKIYIGRYLNIEDADAAYRLAASGYAGEFSYPPVAQLGKEGERG